jgi:hypothetical protein
MHQDWFQLGHSSPQAATIPEVSCVHVFMYSCIHVFMYLVSRSVGIETTTILGLYLDGPTVF